LYTKQHAVETNLFLAPGEGDTKPERGDANGAPGDGANSGALPEAIRLIRSRNG